MKKGKNEIPELEQKLELYRNLLTVMASARVIGDETALVFLQHLLKRKHTKIIKTYFIRSCHYLYKSLNKKYTIKIMKSEVEDLELIAYKISHIRSDRKQLKEKKYPGPLQRSWYVEKDEIKNYHQRLWPLEGKVYDILADVIHYKKSMLDYKKRWRDKLDAMQEYINIKRGKQ